MIALILFALLFACGLLNSYYLFPPSKFMAWLSLLLPKTKGAVVIAKIKEKGSMIVAADKAELETVFATFDRNGDGFITAQELEESLAVLGLFSSDKEVTSMVEKLDANGDGQIDLEEFRELYDSLGRGVEEFVSGGGVDHHVHGDLRGGGGAEIGDLKEAFDVFDGNGDGLITVEELSMVLTSLGLKQGTRSNCRDMIRKVDLDGDGMVSFEEFKQMMMISAVKGGKPF